MALLDKILGKHLATHEEEEQKVGVVAGIPMLGLDALSSAAYGPEAALTILLPLGALGLVYIGPITLIILTLLALLYFSYRQTIAAYPEWRRLVYGGERRIWGRHMRDCLPPPR